MEKLLSKIIEADMENRRQYGYSCFGEQRKDEDTEFPEIFEKELMKNDRKRDGNGAGDTRAIR